jgi:Uma2 family endonuclease
MAAVTQPVTALLTLDEYLHTVYHPDCDFVDGHLEERNLGETAHGLLQMQLGFWFISHAAEWKIRVISELRTRVAPTRVRIPDVSVVLDDAALAERVRQTPPLIAIEIMSPEDRMSRVVKRLDDFVRMGIENIWLLDPGEHVAYTYSKFGLKLSESERLTVEGTPIFLDVPAIFSALPSGL